MVVDADALFALANLVDSRDSLTLSSSQRLLTPHSGELAWFDADFGEVTTDADLRALAALWQSVILHKGFPSRIIDPACDRIYSNPTGNPAATTAGCGDVLAGMCASLLAQGLTAGDAAFLGTYIAGLAADLWVADWLLPSLRASDVISYIPQAVKTALSSK